ncbi:MAG: hypothetical protein ACRBCJ_00435 [Hyphomicrobiaceae bacterium]
MKMKLLTMVVAVVTTVMLLGAPVQAGPKGKKLNFGGNLGTFTATPTRGTSSKKKSSSSYKKRKYNKSKAAAKRKAIARRKAAIKRAKLKKAAAYKKKKAIAARKAKARAKAKAANIAAVRESEAEAAREERLRAREERARIRRENAKERAKLENNGDDDTDTAVNSDDPEISESIDEKTLTAARLDEGEDSDQAGDANELISCKKFIPSAGLTVTVPCEEQ